MEIRFSILARERAFARAMRRIRPRFEPLREAFEKAEFVNPTFAAILVGITDDKKPDFYEEVPNDDGFFQVLSGCTMMECDAKLTRQVFDILRRAARACPFSNVDAETVEKVFESSEPSVVGS